MDIGLHRLLRGPPRGVREPRSAAAHAARTAEPLSLRLRRTVVITLAVAAFLTVTHAFGVRAPPLVRFAYWSAALALAGLAAFPVTSVFRRRGWLSAHPAAGGAALSVAVAAPVCAVIVLLNAAVFRQAADVRAFAATFVPCLAVSACFVALNILSVRRAAPTGEAPAAVEAASPTRFDRRLPHRLRGAEIYAVEAEDHYLRVHTDRGSDLVLMRLADALEELSGVEGARTHRSWWVARGAVTGVRRGDGRATLTLKDGSEAPVSRSFAPALRDAGWF